MAIVNPESSCSAVLEHSFTKEEHNSSDLALLQQMADAIVAKITREDKPAGLPQYLTKNAEGLSRRTVIYGWDELSQLFANPHPTELFFVGFFGTKAPDRTEIVSKEIEGTDAVLVPNLQKLDGMLAYVSTELPDKNWANFVLCRDESVKEKLRGDELHSHAARDISPHFYSSLRLQNGVAYADNNSIHDLRFTKTNYLIFENHSAPKRCTRRYSV